jgi:hydroxymethylpyrimidine pyrophosphatase-like HAD family hydrolase
VSRPVVVVTDLDGTVMFSDRAMGADRPDDSRLRPVDTVGPRTYSYMTDTAAAHWTDLVATGAMVPVTTRSVPQYQRLSLPGPPPRYAVVCNGARLLVDGVSDTAWESGVRRRLAVAAASFAEVWRRAIAWQAGRESAAVRAVEDFFVYITVARRDDRFTELAREADAWGRERGWRASLQGRKLYLLPVSLDKAPAAAEVATRLGAGRVVAGGDSLLDERMLRSADAAIRPAHGELHVTGFSAPHCRTTVGRGAAAGDEILDWYATQLTEHYPPAGVAGST